MDDTAQRLAPNATSGYCTRPMFARAYALARQFTLPVVISHQRVDGQCASGIGAYVVLNRDGWVVTAQHNLLAIRERMEAVERFSERERAVAEIEGDQSLNKKQKDKKLRAVGKLRPTDIKRWSAYWGRNGVEPDKGYELDAVDLGVVRLKPFDPSSVGHYPVFKDPDKEFAPGTSLCKLGFPFHTITPTVDEAARTFRLPDGAIPIPLFPIEGILTRIVEMQPEGRDPATPFPLRFIETSSPGLKGQSGGPIFDTRGVVWGIQSQTATYPLGFRPKTAEGVVEHQFLNVGRGIHSASILGLCRQQGIEIQVADY